MPHRPLLVTSDEPLLDELLRLCAAAGVEAQVAHDATSARLSWTDPPLVVVGSDLVPALTAAQLPRRRGVVVVPVGLDDAAVWDAAAVMGSEGVLPLPNGQALLVDRLGEVADGEAAVGHTVAVIGGRGGAGATTLAVALAMTGVTAGLRCLLMDADPLGGGIDLAIGAEDSTGLRWPDLTAAGGRIKGAALADALPRVNGLSLLSCDRAQPPDLPAQAVRAVLTAAARMSDLVVVDLPRVGNASTEQVLAMVDLTLLMVPAEVRAAAAAAQVAAAAGVAARDLRVVVRGPAPGGLTGPAVATALGLPLAGWLAPEPGLDATLEAGELPGRARNSPITSFCQQLLGELGALRRPAA